MSINPMRNLSVSSGSGGVGRAQNFSTTNLGRESIKNAKVSVGQMNSSAPSTSVSHPGGIAPSATISIHDNLDNASTSVSHPMSDVEVSENDAMVDEKRYNYIKKLVRDRREKEEVEREVGQVGSHDLKIRTGGGFRSKGVKGIRRQLSRLYKKSPSTYKNISMDDRKYFADVVGKHANKVRVGKGFGAPVKRKMKREVNRDWKKNNVISKQDSQDFKKIINNLPH